ncbi:pirin-like C-terminal cupin domain-containing protein [Suipraeoptans intestinalis]|uniref:pirin-like C-terminal cupin domain-containing protein n=1 Tax=Suipraeoptans intestinalis TaxID=2606628 RepID=UPI001F1FB679|nr:pirin-like C-terminal cupin domain-containing protein [Suipraeoptans intestinalis]
MAESSAKDKMTKPAYRSIKRDQIPEVELEGGRLRILAGSYDGQQGVQGNYQPIDYYDITVERERRLPFPQRRADRRCCSFAGGCTGSRRRSGRKDGGSVIGRRPGDDRRKRKRAKVLFLSGSPLKEEIAWGGPVVMNTREELQQAFKELEEGTFIK